MASDGAQMEVERRLRDIGARFTSLPDADDELLRLIEVSAPDPAFFFFLLFSLALFVSRLPWRLEPGMIGCTGCYIDVKFNPRCLDLYK